MKLNIASFGLILVMCLLAAGCTRKHKVYSFEGDTVVPYEDLGILQVHIPASRFTTEGALWTGVEIATLTLADTPTSGDHYRKKLREELAERAEDQYGADAVINVEYWPDPDLETFPEGKIYARGQMIKYKKFPE